jgi:hypothetical protein
VHQQQHHEFVKIAGAFELSFVAKATQRGQACLTNCPCVPVHFSAILFVECQGMGRASSSQLLKKRGDIASAHPSLALPNH